jgi:hypothetical protein
MRKVVKYKNTDKPVYETKGDGITYKIVDVGGTKIKIRVKEDKEIKKDSALFKLYISGPDLENTPLP